MSHLDMESQAIDFEVTPPPHFKGEGVYRSMRDAAFAGLDDKLCRAFFQL